MKKQTQFSLAVANRYGNVDVRDGLPKGYVHVRGRCLQPLCRKLGIRYAEALVRFDGKKRYGFHPVYDGVVVASRSAAKLRAAVQDRAERALSPCALAQKERARQARQAKAARQEEERCKREAAREERCSALGIDPNGKTAEWLERGVIDDDYAELLGFKAAYRHEYTDYEGWFSQGTFRALREGGSSPTEAREIMRQDARAACQEDPIPATWHEYLRKYLFQSPIAQAMAGVLKEPQKAHPIWFAEAEIAVRRKKLPLDQLTYEAIAEAVEAWRRERPDIWASDPVED